MSSSSITDNHVKNIIISVDDIIQFKVVDKTMNNTNDTNDNILHVAPLIQVLMAIMLIIMIMLSIY